MLWRGFLLAWLLAALFMFIVGVQRNLGATHQFIVIICMFTIPGEKQQRNVRERFHCKPESGREWARAM